MSAPVSSVRVVLVRPRNPLNIGACARAMANFGLADLWVVRPHPPVWRDAVSAVGAEKLLLSARRAGALEEALADRHLVLGTTALRSRRLERPVVALPELGAFLRDRLPPGGRAALLFGPEKTGLSNAHLERCDAYLTIPTHPETPSMNLSHAVAVCCYELSRGGLASRSAPARVPAERADLDRIIENLLALFKAVGYLDFLSPAQKRAKLRRAFLQWRVGAEDVRLFHGFLRYALGALKPRRP